MKTDADITKQSKELLVWANNLLKMQNEAFMQSCADLREVIDDLRKENETLKTNNAVLKCTVQRITGV